MDRKVLREAQSKATLENLEGSVVTVLHECSLEERQYLEKIYGKPVLYKPCKTSAHPVFSHLNDHAHQKTASLRTRGYEIGANPTKLPTALHGCSINQTARDEKRHIEHCMTLARRNDRNAFQDAFLGAFNGQPNGTYHFNGIENEHTQIDTAIAIHSMYDITDEQIAKFLEQTGCKIIYIYLLLPADLFDKRVTSPFWDLAEHGNETTMTFRRPNGPHAALGYTHNTENWKRWMNRTGTSVGGVSWMTEINEIIGPMCQITLVRTTKPDRIFNTIELQCDEMVLLPDHRKFKYTKDCHVIPCPRYIFDDGMTYAMSLATPQFTLETLRAFFRGKTRGIKIGEIVRLESWKVDNETFMRVTQAVYMIAYSMRRQTSREALLARDMVVEHEGRKEKTKKLVLGRAYKAWYSTKDYFKGRHRGPNYPRMTINISEDFAHELYAKPFSRIQIEQNFHDATPWNMGMDIEPNVPVKEQWGENELAEATKLLKDEQRGGNIYLRGIKIFEGRGKADVRMLVGPPGCGKTTWLRKTFPHADVIVPARKLMQDYIDAGFQKVNTHHAGLRGVGELCIIDECFQLDIAIVNQYAHRYKRVVVIGDPLQIERIDFEKIGWDKYRIRPNMWPTFSMSNVTYRCPQDVVQILQHVYQWEGKSGVRESIHCQPTRSLDFSMTNQPIMTFTQQTKGWLASRGYNSMTIHEAQGLTFQNAGLYLDNNEYALCARSRGHFIVSLTRHTHQLKIFTDKENFISLIPNLLEGPDSVMYEPVNIETLFKEPIECPTPVVSGTHGVEDVLDKVTLGQTDRERIQPMEIPIEADTTGQIGEIVDKVDREESIVMKGKSYAHITKISDQQMTVNTLMTRYAKKVFAEEDAYTGEQLIQLLQTWIFGEGEANWPQIKQDDLDFHTLDALLTMYKRNTLKDTHAFMEDGDDEKTFFLKQQCKVKTAEIDIDEPEPKMNGMYKGKVGQGVSAWAKPMNRFFGPIVRAMQDAFSEVLIGSRNETIFAYNASEKSFDDFFKTVSGFDGETMCADITEFDSTHSEATIDFEGRLMVLMGIPENVVEIYKSLRQTWTLNTFAGHRLAGKTKQHSGQPSTLFANSLVCLLVNISMLNREQILNGDYAIAIKGDDSFIRSKTGPINAAVIEAKLKMNATVTSDQEHAPQFINNFVTPFGLVPDVIRLAAKVKSYDSRTHNNSKIRGPNVTTYDGKISGKHHVALAGTVHPTWDLLAQIEHAYYVLGVRDISTVYQSNVNYSRITKTCPHVRLRIFEYKPFSEATVREFQQSVRDRLKPLRDIKRRNAGLACAAQFYQQDYNAVEMTYNWCSTFANCRDLMQHFEKVRPALAQTVMAEIRNQADQYYRNEVSKPSGTDGKIRSSSKLRDILKHLTWDKLCGGKPAPEYVSDASAAPGGWLNLLTDELGDAPIAYYKTGALKMMAAEPGVQLGLNAIMNGMPHNGRYQILNLTDTECEQDFLQPVHRRDHWMLLCKRKDKRILYDSLIETEIGESTANELNAEYRTSALQDDGWSCGYWVINMAWALQGDTEIDTTQTAPARPVDKIELNDETEVLFCDASAGPATGEPDVVKANIQIMQSGNLHPASCKIIKHQAEVALDPNYHYFRARHTNSFSSEFYAITPNESLKAGQVTVQCPEYVMKEGKRTHNACECTTVHDLDSDFSHRLRGEHNAIQNSDNQTVSDNTVISNSNQTKDGKIQPQRAPHIYGGAQSLRDDEEGNATGKVSEGLSTQRKPRRRNDDSKLVADSRSNNQQWWRKPTNRPVDDGLRRVELRSSSLDVQLPPNEPRDRGLHSVTKPIQRKEPNRNVDIFRPRRNNTRQRSADKTAVPSRSGDRIPFRVYENSNYARSAS
jgi:hypothetical protein